MCVPSSPLDGPGWSWPPALGSAYAARGPTKEFQGTPRAAAAAVPVSPEVLSYNNGPAVRSLARPCIVTPRRADGGSGVSGVFCSRRRGRYKLTAPAHVPGNHRPGLSRGPAHTSPYYGSPFKRIAVPAHEADSAAT